MKKLILLLVILLSVSGCAYNSMTIHAAGASTVNCNGSVEKPVKVDTQATIPLLK